MQKIHKIITNSFSNKEEKTTMYKRKAKKPLRSSNQCGRCLPAFIMFTNWDLMLCFEVIPPAFILISLFTHIISTDDSGGYNKGL